MVLIEKETTTGVLPKKEIDMFLDTECNQYLKSYSVKELTNEEIYSFELESFDSIELTIQVEKDDLAGLNSSDFQHSLSEVLVSKINQYMNESFIYSGYQSLLDRLKYKKAEYEFKKSIRRTIKKRKKAQYAR